MTRRIYLIGSLRNPEIPKIANMLREDKHEVFDDWYAAGPNADDHWRDYEKQRGRTFTQALSGLAAKHVYAFDREHLEKADTGLLILPAGKSGHLELGWMLGKGKNCFVLVDSPERWDVMYQFATGVFDDLDMLRYRLSGVPKVTVCNGWFYFSPFSTDSARCQRPINHEGPCGLATTQSGGTV